MLKLGLEEEVKSARTILFGDEENLENFSTQYTTTDLETLDEIM